MSAFTYSVSTDVIMGLGIQQVEVIASSPATALVEASRINWHVEEAQNVTIRCTGNASCTHSDGSGIFTDDVLTGWSCTDCPVTWSALSDSYPAPTATAKAFRIYCENLRQLF